MNAAKGIAIRTPDFDPIIHGEIELEADYQKGQRSVDEFLKYTAIANPHARIVYISPEKTTTEFVRATNELPKTD